jgi:SNF2 family DNA or RNA helicase
MIVLDYLGEDLFSVEADQPVWHHLDELYRRENRHFVARFQNVEEGGERFSRFVIHMHYLPVHLDLLQSEAISRLNAQSADPRRWMTEELRHEMVHWQRRLDGMAAVKDVIEPGPGWNPLGEFHPRLKLPLRPYQEAGVAWMAHAENGLLADPTGLGKTPMSIGYAVAMIRMGLAKDVLILCPHTLKLQFCREGIEKFAPAGMDDYTLIDSKSYPHKREKLWHNTSTWTVANYEIVRQDIDRLDDRRWGIVIADECQILKHPAAKVTKAAKRLQASYRFGLTATPVETALTDLFSLMEWINAGILGSASLFHRDYVVERGPGNMAVAYRWRSIQEEIPKKIAPVKLRRKKELVLPQLPELQITPVPVVMTGEQATLYQEMEDEEGEAIAALERTKGVIDVMTILEKVLRLTQIADSPELINPDLRAIPCAKIAALRELLESFDGKILIFSRWKKMIKILEREMSAWIREKKTSVTQILTVTGDVKCLQTREQIKDTFNQSYARTALLLTDAWRYGVNLSAAQAVIQFELPWNPATMMQRIGRAHRILGDDVNRLGASHHVFAYNLICENTVESRIAEVLDFRTNLADVALADTEEMDWARRLDQRTLRYILTGKER